MPPKSSTKAAKTAKSTKGSKGKKGSAKGSKGKKEKKVKEKKPAVPAPFYKRVPGTTYLVDGFRYKSELYDGYFLSHGHSDHTVGITKNFGKFGTVYCSRITAAFIIGHLGVKKDCVHVLPMYETVDVGGTQVTMLDANHCPGAVVFIFKVPDGRVFVHTGDFRYHDGMGKEIQEWVGSQPISALYLDTTFLKKKFQFPKQHYAINHVVSVIREELKVPGNDPLFLMGTYTIGKEKILNKVAEEFASPVAVSTTKYKLMEYLEQPMSHFTTDVSESRFHAVSMGELSFAKMAFTMDYLNNTFGSTYNRVVAFQPTGWRAKKHPSQWTHDEGRFTKWMVPYSEHSNYAELLNCVKTLRPRKIIPTVDCETKAKIEAQRAHFQGMTDDSMNKGSILWFLSGGGFGGGGGFGASTVANDNADDGEDEMVDEVYDGPAATAGTVDDGDETDVDGEGDDDQDGHSEGEAEDEGTSLYNPHNLELAASQSPKRKKAVGGTVARVSMSGVGSGGPTPEAKVKSELVGVTQSRQVASQELSRSLFKAEAPPTTATTTTTSTHAAPTTATTTTTAPSGTSANSTEEQQDVVDVDALAGDLRTQSTQKWIMLQIQRELEAKKRADAKAALTKSKGAKGGSSGKGAKRKRGGSTSKLSRKPKRQRQ